MSKYDAMAGRKSALGPIRPTGLGYRSVSNFFLVLALLGTVLALLAMFSGDEGTVFIAFSAVAWCASTGVLFRVISDFLAALADISRALREKQ